MKVLHYTLGMPPYRTGGLTKYSVDLMKAQVESGHKVHLLFPGRISFMNNKTKIKYYKNEFGIIVHEMINPLPVPLLNGTSNPLEFMRKCSKSIFIDFLNDIKIDILHVHTFMGLFKELLEACRELDIKIVYTTHDYYGLCTKVNFVDYNGEICNERILDKCIKCNCTGHSMKTMKILQSRTYRFFKNKGVVSKTKSLLCKIKRKKANIELKSDVSEMLKSNIDRNEYEKLIGYYNLMYSYIDKFLFNSTVAKNVYDKYLHIKGNIISITHSEIRDNRVKKYYENKKLKLTYLGPNREYKGFHLLIDIMKSLEKEGYEDIALSAYGDETIFEGLPGNVKINGRYSYNQLKEIFEDTDLLVVPSIWKETFGFITLEALSYGVPVLLTNEVGSKDLVSDGNLDKGIVTVASKNAIKDKIIKIYNDRDLLKKFNENILKDNFNGLIKEHYYNINSTYLEIIGESL